MTRSNSELREKLQDIWIGASGVRLDAQEIDKTLALIDKQVEKGKIEELKPWLARARDIDFKLAVDMDMRVQGLKDNLKGGSDATK